MQTNWQQPNRKEWVNSLAGHLNSFRINQSILIGHSVGCATIVHTLNEFNLVPKAVMLVAPSDVEAPNYPAYITGFSPMPLTPLSCPSVVIASTNDHVVSLERAQYFAKCWASKFITLENAGHIEAQSGYGNWPLGLKILFELNG